MNTAKEKTPKHCHNTNSQDDEEYIENPPSGTVHRLFLIQNYKLHKPLYRNKA